MKYKRNRYNGSVRNLWPVVRNAPLHIFVHLLIGLVRILPEQWAYGMGKGLALLAWHCFTRWRRTACRNMELLFQGELPLREMLAIGRQSAINLGYYVIEFIRMGFLPVERGLAMVVESEGLEHLHAALAQERGVIGLALHYGNWDLSGAYVHNRVRTLCAVGKPQSDAFFTKLAFPWRARYGVKNIFSGKRANSAILRALRDNCVLGLVADQNGGSTGIFAPLAGVPASTVPGPAVLALKTGAPMMVIFCRRLAPGRHRLIVKPPLDLSGLPPDHDSAVVEVLRRMNEAYAQVIREDPSQWLWGHKRWKTRPPGEPWLYR